MLGCNRCLILVLVRLRLKHISILASTPFLLADVLLVWLALAVRVGAPLRLLRVKLAYATSDVGHANKTCPLVFLYAN